MIIFPAIDLQAGSCVRLERGNFAAATSYDSDPLVAAKRFEDQGASWLHIVDLDGAKDGAARQTLSTSRVAAQTTLRIQAGGGIRSAGDVETLLQAGVDRIVIGSLSVQNPELVKGWLRQFGPERIALAVDIRMDDQGTPYLLTRGWQDESSQTLWDVLSFYQVDGLKTVLCTDVSRDGMLNGPNLDLYSELRKRYPFLDILASGGIATLDDIRSLADLRMAGAITGKALYEKKFTLSDAVAVANGRQNAG